MIIQDSRIHATNFSRLAQEFLTEHKIAPTPINYSVIYLYFSKRHDDLTEEIEQRLSFGQPIDSIFIESMFNKYVSQSDAIENKVMMPFETTLSDTLEKVNLQVVAEQHLSNSLKKADKVLSKDLPQESVQTIINYLVGAISQSQDQREQLSQQLEQTSNEVNQLKNKLEESRKEAAMDALTGLLNRRGCEQKLKELDIADEHSSLVIDIDHFKSINDTYGHAVGDNVIQHIAKVIKSNVSDKDIAVRFGGEEFMVVLANKTITEAKKAAEKIRLAISQLKLLQRKSNTFLPAITVSVGITQAQNDSDWKSIFDRADRALYQAKNNGRNCCVTQ